MIAMEDKHFKILQWNIRGFNSNKNEITALIDKYRPQIILLQETFLTQEVKIKLKNYIVIRKDRTRHGGGVLVGVEKNIGYTEINIGSNLEVIAINTVIQNRIYSIVNIYLPPNRNICKQELDQLQNKLEKDLIIAGDMNAHHHRWNSPYLNNRGKIIDEFLEQNHLTVLNNKENTYYHHNKQNSNIDLAITNLTNFCKWNYFIHEDLSGSDHFPILMSHKMNKVIISRSFNKINYATINENMSKLQITDNMSIESHNNIIIKTLQTALEKTPNSQQNTSKVKKYNVWWNIECKKAVKNRKKAFQKFKSYPTTKHWLEYKRLTSISKITINTAKRESFKNFIHNLKHIPTSKELWNKIKMLQNNPVTPTTIMLKEQNCYITENIEIANILANHFQEISSEKLKSKDFITYKTTQRINLAEKIDLNNDNENYNKVLTLKELENALRNIKNTAPGEDNITYAMIESLNAENKLKILRLFNDIWTKGVIPQQWKNSIIIPILKNGKNKQDKNSYRPISLTSVLSKIMEKLIKERLIFKLDAESKLYNNQTGFKKDHNTYDSILKLESAIKRNLLENNFTVAIFLDLEKAYDSVYIDGLKLKLEKLNIKGRLLKYLYNFLTNRTFKVRYKENFSAVKNIEYGLPQGTILSPHLFNIMTIDLLEILKENATMYADDLCIWESDKDVNIAINKLQTKLDTTIEWMNKNGFKISKTKTKYIIFTHKRKYKLHKGITIGIEKIEQVNHYKYLGLILDQKLDWNRHIQYIKNRCKNKMTILKYISHRKWGTNKHLIIKVYETIVRSIIDYGIFIYYPSLNNTNKLILNRIQYEAIRMASGNLKNTIVEVLEGVLGILPIRYRSEKLAFKFGIKRSSITFHETTKELMKRSHVTNENFSKYPLPIFGWINKVIEESGINLREIENIKFLYSKYPSIIYDLSLAKQQKRYFIKEKIRQEFLQRKYYYKKDNYSIIATDGSKKDGKVGCGILFNTQKYKFKLPSHSSIYTAELFSIYKTITIAKTKRISKLLILTDSMSAIQGIKNNKQDHFIINKIYHTLEESTHLVLLWVPSHIGIIENEVADTLAQEAGDSGANVEMGFSIDEAVKICQLSMRNRWKLYWQQKNYFSFKINPLLKKTNLNMNRRDQVVLDRLRCDNPRFKYNHFYANEPPLKCLCGEIQKLEHAIKCDRYQSERGHLMEAYEIETVQQLDLSTLLNIDTFKVEFLDFLKKTNIYNHV